LEISDTFGRELKEAFEADSLPRPNAVTGRDASERWLFFLGKTLKAF